MSTVIPFGRSANVTFKAFLAARGITDDKTIDALGYRYQTREQLAKLLGYQPSSDGFTIDYYDAAGVPIFEKWSKAPFARARLLQVEGNGKYQQPKGTAVHARLTPNSRWDWSEVGREHESPLLIVEGEMKADRGNTADWGKDGKPTEPPVVGISGVDCWKGRDTPLVPEINPWGWQGRPVYICFDHDSTVALGFYKPGVHGAQTRLASALTALGARVWLVHIGRTDKAKVGTKCGLDDYIEAGGTWEDLLATATVPTDGPLEKLLRDYGVYHPTGDVISLTSGMTWPFGKWAQTIVGDQFIPGAEKPLPASRAWVQSGRKTIVEGYVQRPDLRYGVGEVEGKTVFNRWKGWPDDGERDEAIERVWVEFVRRFLGTAERAGWFHSWVAWSFQNPHVRNTTSWFVVSPLEGVGKSLLVETVAGAAGGCGRVHGPEALHGDYNRHLIEGALFAAINELSDGKVDYRRFKNYRTAEQVTINEKFQPRWSAENYLNFMVTTNEMATHRTDADARRDIVVSPAEECAAPEWREWLRGVVAGMLKSEAGLSAVRWFYLHYGCAAWDPNAPAPITYERETMDEVTDSAAEELAKRLIEVMGPRFVVRVAALREICGRERASALTVIKHVRHKLRCVGTGSRLVKIDGKPHRCYVVGPQGWEPDSWVDAADAGGETLMGMG